MTVTCCALDSAKRRPSDNNDFYYHFAIGSMLVSALTVIILVVSIPMLFARVARDRDVMASKSEKFKVRAWYGQKLS